MAKKEIEKKPRAASREKAAAKSETRPKADQEPGKRVEKTSVKSAAKTVAKPARSKPPKKAHLDEGHLTADQAPVETAKPLTVKTRRSSAKTKKEVVEAAPREATATVVPEAVPVETKPHPAQPVEIPQPSKPPPVSVVAALTPTSAPVAPAPALPKVTPAPVEPLKKKIVLTPQATVKELAGLLGVGISDVIKRLMGFGVWATINQRLEPDMAKLVAGEMGFEVEVPKVFEQEEASLVPRAAEGAEHLQPRAPIVTIMGHVDHGKTTLLDAIRQTRVAEQEAGGITQHIGAYKVKTSKGEIVFLDTPGHEAFTAMRARGAKVTDMVVLVVAADDRVMPQTIEAIDHAKAGGVKIVVAINKVDKPEANVNRVKQELGDLGLVPEEWGGKTVMVEVSAKKKINIDKLLEMILLEAELMELKANPDRPAAAAILEARKDPKKGNVASVLVSDGTLRVGDPFLCGITWGKVRAMVDEHNVKLTQAPPATPVMVLGFEEVAQAGDRLLVAKDERQAREIAGRRKIEFETIHGKKATKHLMLEDLHEKIEQGLVKEFRIVLRADMQGSLEAIVGELSKLHHEEVVIKVLHAGVGSISLSDVLLAAASDAVVLGFHVLTDNRAEEEAKRESVELRIYSVIYELIDDARAALEGLLTPIIKENVLGSAEVRKSFKVTGVGHVAGCMVLQGKMTRGMRGRVWRKDAKLLEGKVTSLKRVKDDVAEVAHGYECGVVISGYNDPRPGDRIECFEEVKELKKLASKTAK
ncbi:MAG: translation initiation factor IF-2 [Elusimicrobia bacterium]|nr:translation initiation factor IF-2 [Elusimicrobiota bacterium]